MRFISAAVVTALLTSSAAWAQEEPGTASGGSDCPPGSWFCGKTEAEAPAAAPAPAGAPESNLEPLPPATEAKAAGEKAPPVAPSPPPAESTGARQAPAHYDYTPRRVKPKSEVGINLHLGGMPIPTTRSGGAGMAVFGGGLRLRPIPELALQGDLDLAAGRDSAGRDRNEVGLAVNGMVFVNPKSKVQLYFVAGLGWQAARASGNRLASSGGVDRFTYFGGQGGAGLEFRVSKVFAIDLDARALVRTRVDSRADSTFEFASSTGRRTNTSGGALFSGGITLYF